MTRRALRIALTVLSIGFGLEGFGELYEFLTPGARLPAGNTLYVFPLLLALSGLAFVWVGRDEWTEVHRAQARIAADVFAASVLGGFVAVGLLAALAEHPSAETSLWAEAAFGGAIGSVVFGTLVTYSYLLYSLGSKLSRWAIRFALTWALLVSADLGVLFGANLPTVVAEISQRSLGVPAFLGTASYLFSLLFVSFFLLFAVSVEAHVAVVRGRVVVPERRGVPVSRNA
jgi:hypothetical protein